MKVTADDSIPTHPGLVLGVAAGLAIPVGLVIQFGLSGQTRELANLVGVVLLIFLALLAAARRALRPGSEAKGWQLLSLSLLISFLIQGSRILVVLGYRLPHTIGSASVGLQVLGSCLQVGALLGWHLNPRTRFDRIRHGLDGLLFALAVFFILWALVLGPVFLSDQFPMAARLTWLATFLIYDLLLGLAVYFGLSQPARFRGPLGWLTAAFLLACMYNFRWLLAALAGTPMLHYRPGDSLIFLIPLTYLGAALSPHPVGSTAPPGRPVRFLLALPYLPVLGATLLGIGLLTTEIGSGHRLHLVWLALALVLIVLIRQYLALRDFSNLSQQLETRVAERTQALEQAQALLLRTERMNSMATLGAGLAHDMNNLLSAIQSRTELVIIDLDEGKLPERKDMVRVQEATRLVASLSSRLMAMGRQDPEPPRVMNLVEELRAIQPLLQVLLPRNQTLQLVHGSGMMPFLGSRGLLEQILVNLVSNARDAMPSGGIIAIRARPPKPEESSLGPLLEIEDSGTGIPEDLHDRIFQPFFTTKASGTGTGLGLASVKSLLEKAGGSIHFVTQVGHGTTFQVRLPRLPSSL